MSELLSWGSLRLRTWMCTVWSSDGQGKGLEVKATSLVGKTLVFPDHCALCLSPLPPPNPPLLRTQCFCEVLSPGLER